MNTDCLFDRNHTKSRNKVWKIGNFLHHIWDIY